MPANPTPDRAPLCSYCKGTGWGESDHAPGTFYPCHTCNPKAEGAPLASPARAEGSEPTPLTDDDWDRVRAVLKAVGEHPSFWHHRVVLERAMAEIGPAIALSRSLDAALLRPTDTETGA